MAQSEDNPINKLAVLLGSGSKSDHPDHETMVKKALEILELSPVGQQLVRLYQDQDISVQIVYSHEEQAYAHDNTHVVISMQAHAPAQPAQFTLMLAGALRDIAQHHEGYEIPDITGPEEQYITNWTRKQGNKVAYLCAIAHDLNNMETFSRYNFLDELRKMGHGETLDVFLEEIRKHNI